MPYAPGIEYRGDQYIAQGIGQFGQAIGGSIEEWKKKHDQLIKDLGQSDAIVNAAHEKGYIDPETYTKYISGSSTQKTGIAEGIAKTMVLDQQAQEAEANRQNAIKIAQIAHAASGGGLGPDPLEGQPYNLPGTEKPIGVHTRHGIQFFPGQAMESGAEDTGVVSSPLLDADKKPVPGKVVVTKPGSNAFSIQDTATTMPDIQMDPTKTFYWNPKTGVREINPKTARRLQGGELAVPTQGGIRSYLPTWLGGTPNPTPAPTPMQPLPNAPVGTVAPIQPLPNAAPTVPALTPQAQAIQVKSDFAAGNISRDEALKRLKALGFD